MVQYVIITVKFHLAKVLIFILLKLLNFHAIKQSIKPQTTTSLPYKKLQLDLPLPIISYPKKYDYKLLLEKYQQTHRKPHQPIKRRKPITFDPKIACPACSAPAEYLYDNNGSRGQLICKVCNSTFHKSTNRSPFTLRCPYCHKDLYKIKDRCGFFIYKCTNNDCPFYKSKLNSLSKELLQDYKLHPYKYKLHYIFRDFKFTIHQLATNSPDKPKIDLARAHKPLNVVGIVLTLFANFGLSSRMIRDIMNCIFDVKISHQTVLNYVNYAAYILNPFIASFKHLISNPLVGDETYIKIKGIWHYIFFILDPQKQIILANFISRFRDTFSAASAILQTINSSLNKSIFKSISCFKPTFVFDGNPIYQLAQMFFSLNNIFFDLVQVVGGVRNWRFRNPYWFIFSERIERLIRTFKDHYRHTNGFDNINGAVSFVILFTAFFNFLRPNKFLNYNIPIPIKELLNIPYAPAKWIKLIELAQNFALQNTQESLTI